jgi:hypothetical protein
MPLSKEVSMPQRAWSAKENRQYEHIKESARERGRSPRRAKEIAARTVNKQRREKGKTENKRTMGTGNPNQPLQERTVDELHNIAREKHIQGRSWMRKQELVQAIRRSRR